MRYTEPGVIVTQSDVEDYLRSSNRYKNLYNNVENQLLQGINTIEQQYSTEKQSIFEDYSTAAMDVGRQFTQNMSDTFNDISKSKNQLIASNMGEGYRMQALSDLERVAMNAYDTYTRGYISDRENLDAQLAESNLGLEQSKSAALQTASDTAAKEISALNKIVSGEAQHYVDIYNAPRQYLSYLAENDEQIYENPEFAKFFNVRYEGGSPIYELKSDKELNSLFYDYDGENITGLNQTGLDFYNQMFYGTDGLSTSFGAWLSGTNKELYDWAMSGTNLQDAASYIDKGLSDVVSKHKYQGDISDAYAFKPNTTFAYSKDFGDINRYITGSNVTLNVMESLKLDGINTDDVVDDKTEDFSATYEDIAHTKRKYNMRISKDAAVASDEVLTDIVKSTGEIKDGKLYAYGDTLYLAFVLDGSTVLKEVTVKNDSSDAFWNTLKNDEELKKDYDEDEHKSNVPTPEQIARRAPAGS